MSALSHAGGREYSEKVTVSVSQLSEAKKWQLSEEKILFRNGELNLLVPGSGCHRRGRGMGGQDGLRADADVL